MTNLTKSDLVAVVAEKTGLTKKDTTEVIDAVASAIKDLTAAGNSVAIRDFGKFTMKDRAARTGRNPATGAPIEIAASRVLSFKPSKSST